MTVPRTQVAIVGAGPAGLMLSLLLAREGIESVIVEQRSREYIEARVRAGLLEQNTVDLMRRLGVGERLDREGLVHEGISLRRPGATERVPITELTGRHVTIYGQQEVVKDLCAAVLEAGVRIVFEAADVAVTGIDSEHSRPRVSWDGGACEADFVAGCDGFHGPCRGLVPESVLVERSTAMSFAWLGILVHAAPATDELIYAWHPDGFALYSMRSPQVSRLYLQVDADERIEDWSDDRIWTQLHRRLATGEDGDGAVNEGEIFEKNIAPIRSCVYEPMQYGRLYLAGDAVHIVPPTGAKGLNLAVNDARLLAAGFTRFYADGSRELLDRYTETALRRVWRAEDFSNYMTGLLHDLGTGPFDRRLQLSRLEYLGRSRSAAESLAENYAGLPATDDF